MDRSTQPDSRARLLAIAHPPDLVGRSTRRIYAEVLAQSAFIREGNFRAIGEDDLRLLFRIYDDHFFENLLGRMLREGGSGEVTFRLSARMTKAAGKTIMTRPRSRSVDRPPVFEIAVSTLLLFQNFEGPGRPVSVGGLPCADRLEVLQRTFEHELLHLAEFLAWGTSSCLASRFHALSRRIFGHEGTTHDLVTPREFAAESFRIRVGDMVSFEHQGRRHLGRVNRITRRATVLVENPNGLSYSDGHHYSAFYVPIPSLRKEGPPD